MSEELQLRCEDSIDGILTALYDAFVYKNNFTDEYTDSIKIAIGDEAPLSLFAKEIDVVTSQKKMTKTIYAVQKKLGWRIYDRVIHALCHFDEDRGSVVLGYLVRAFKVGQRIDEQLADPYVMRTFELCRKVYNEEDKLKGFLRFEDTGYFLFGEIEPKCNVVPVFWEHFADRYPNENFVIYDNKRKLSYVHPAYSQGTFVEGRDLHNYFGGTEDYFTSLWKQYFATMGIKERKNESCQNNLAPKWYRKNMVEFS